MRINPLTAIDFYKADHRRQYPYGTTSVYSNLTARSNRLAKFIDDGQHDNKVVFFGLQYFIKDFLMEAWNVDFFGKLKSDVLREYQRRMDHALGIDAINVEHIADLHDLGYLPIKIKALPEGSRVPIGVPFLTMVNTHPNFFWLTNYLESVLSCYLWQPITTATIAFEYKRLLTKYAMKTGTSLDFVDIQAHDFSFRGMSSLQTAMISGAAHLTSFKGTDSVPCIDLIEQYYCADASKDTIGVSVPATEHSVMCMGAKESEIFTFHRLITQTYPTGVVSIVSDTWDFWQVITEFLPSLKSIIMRRDGKVVIRPDSGDPVKIICGDDDERAVDHMKKGAVECLWDTFGGTETDKGYKLLDSHIGLIYGDSITLDRAQEIMERLEKKGFASGNVVLGVGSYSYQYNTRDNHGMAVKATHGVVNGESRAIFKDPKTDSGEKKSAKGLLRVESEQGNYLLFDEQLEEHEDKGLLDTVFVDGGLVEEVEFQEIRMRLNMELENLRRT